MGWRRVTAGAAVVATIVPAALAVGAAAPEAAFAGPVTAEASVTDISSQSRARRPPIRVFIDRPIRALPPDAVRRCRAWYVQELRPSGTVVVPRMQCWWARG